MYDQHDSLLYVGISGNFSARLKAHAATQWWWPEVRRIAVTHYVERAAALAAEREAIETEAPRWNIVHSRSAERRRARSNPSTRPPRSRRRSASKDRHADNEALTTLRLAAQARIAAEEELRQAIIAERDEIVRVHRERRGASGTISLIAKATGYSREHIRQIIKSHTPTPSPASDD